MEYFEWRPQFTLLFYLPRLQRTYAINLDRTLTACVPQKELERIAGEWRVPPDQLTSFFFEAFRGARERKIQHQLWNSFTSLFRFETQPYGDTLQVLLRIGAFSAFLKDLSFSEYLELSQSIFHLEISVARRAQLITPN